MRKRAQRNRPYCALSEQQTIVEYLDSLKSSAQQNRPYCALSEQQTIVEYLDSLKSKVARLQVHSGTDPTECTAEPTLLCTFWIIVKLQCTAEPTLLCTKREN